jgi:hypothetical protein
MSPERIEDAKCFRALGRVCGVSDRHVRLNVVTTATKAQHVALAEALVLPTRELREPEDRRVRGKVLAHSVVDEENYSTAPREQSKSSTAPTVTFNFARTDAIRSGN